MTSFKRQRFLQQLHLHVTRVNSSHFLANFDMMNSGRTDDPDGAVMFVVVVVMLWSLSIVLLIASYVRKNRADTSANLYIKEIQTVRKQSRKQRIVHFVSLMQAATLRHATSLQRLGSASSCDSRSLTVRSASPAFADWSLKRQESDASEAGARQASGTEAKAAEAAGDCEAAERAPLLLTAQPPVMKRHSFGCLLPQICILSDEQPAVKVSVTDL